LIVVAIIGILAAIAIPNFLHAQTRAKVARVKADMHSLTVALESYAVDYTSYIMDNYMIWVRTGVFYDLRESLYQLTSPIEFISDVARDPFQGIHERPWDGGPNAPYIYEGSGPQYKDVCPGCSVTIAYENSGFQWIMSSYGPSKTQLYDGTNSLGAGTILSLYSLGQPGGHMVYDPTNGVLSFGMIINTDKGVFKP
jgi:general secretion pathway protein G